MEIKIGSYEDVLVDRAAIPAPDLILNMEFLFAAKLTPAELLQWPSVASAMEPLVGDAWGHLLSRGPLSWSTQPLPRHQPGTSPLSPRPLLLMSHSAAGTAASPMDQSRASHSLHPFRLNQDPAGPGQPSKDDTSVMSEDALDTLTTKDYNDRPTHPSVPLPGETTEWRFPEENFHPSLPNHSGLTLVKGTSGSSGSGPTSCPLP
jgi:hypothetical protein